MTKTQAEIRHSFNEEFAALLEKYDAELKWHPDFSIRVEIGPTFDMKECNLYYYTEFDYGGHITPQIKGLY